MTNNIEDNIKNIGAVIIVIIVIISVGNIYHWFDWIGPTLSFIWLLVKILFVLAIIGLVGYGFYRYKNKDQINMKKKEKEEENRKNQIQIEEEHIKQEKIESEKLKIPTDIALKRIVKLKSKELKGLNKKEKEYKITKWKSEILDLLKEGKDEEEVVAILTKKEPTKPIGSTSTKIKPHIDNDESIFHKILEEIKQCPTDRKVLKEREFENGLYTFLKAKFPNLNVRSQYPTKYGRVDIVIDDKIALELKVADNKGVMKEVYSQIIKYKKSFKKVVVVILDVGNIPTLGDDVEDFKKLGASVIILHGSKT